MHGKVRCFQDQLVHPVTKDRERTQRGYRHDQTSYRGNESLVNPFRQVTGTSRPFRDRYLVEGKDHPDDCTEQAYHGSNISNPRHILALAI